MTRVRDLDQFEGGLVHLLFEIFIPIPVAVGLLDYDAAFHQQALENVLDVELRIVRIAHAERDIFEITKYREILVNVVGGHRDTELA